MQRLKHFLEKNEKWLSPVVLIGGFVIDNLTLRRADLLLEHVLLGTYFVLLPIFLVIFHALGQKETKSVREQEAESLLFLAIQFIFGGLFSALTVFYIRSTVWWASWPFLAVLFAGMIATEYFKKHFSRFIVQVTTFYLLLFTYLIVLVPLFTKRISPAMFVISGLLSLLIVFGYLVLFKKIVPQLFVGRVFKVGLSIVLVFAGMNVSYFMNIIPPIPLVLKDSGVYKTVIRNDSGYVFSDFPRHFSWTKFSAEYTIPAGAEVYFYSAIYAPAAFEQQVVHEWQKKNASGDWMTASRVMFPIYGGSVNGYRGYSVSGQVTPGEWRVRVKTRSGQVIGGQVFWVR